jgi:hypothetical protein
MSNITNYKWKEGSGISRFFSLALGQSTTMRFWLIYVMLRHTMNVSSSSSAHISVETCTPCWGHLMPGSTPVDLLSCWVSALNRGHRPIYVEASLNAVRFLCRGCPRSTQRPGCAVTSCDVPSKLEVKALTRPGPIQACDFMWLSPQYWVWGLYPEIGVWPIYLVTFCGCLFNARSKLQLEVELFRSYFVRFSGRLSRALVECFTFRHLEYFLNKMPRSEEKPFFVYSRL